MALSEQDKKEITSLIREVVNGKIDKLVVTVTEHGEKLDKHIEVLEPVVEGVVWINSTRRFILWFSAVAGAMVGIISLGKFLK